MLLAAARAVRRIRRARSPVGGDAGRTKRTRRVLAISSGGGHWVELLRLRPALEGHDVVWCTVDEAYRPQIGRERFEVVPDVTRWDRAGLVRCASHVLRVLLLVRPYALLSTGALPGLSGEVERPPEHGTGEQRLPVAHGREPRVDADRAPGPLVGLVAVGLGP